MLPLLQKLGCIPCRGRTVHSCNPSRCFLMLSLRYVVRTGSTLQPFGSVVRCCKYCTIPRPKPRELHSLSATIIHVLEAPPRSRALTVSPCNRVHTEFLTHQRPPDLSALVYRLPKLLDTRQSCYVTTTPGLPFPTRPLRQTKRIVNITFWARPAFSPLSIH